MSVVQRARVGWSQPRAPDLRREGHRGTVLQDPQAQARNWTCTSPWNSTRDSVLRWTRAFFTIYNLYLLVR